MSDQPKFRCIECGEYHEGECDPKDQFVFAFLNVFDAFNEILGDPPEPGSRRWLIEQGEYPADTYPTGVSF